MKLRPLVFTALFAALTACGAFLRIPLAMITITLQYFFTILAGVLLGKKYGALSQAIYVLLGLIGLPVFASGGGFSYVLQPSFGFLPGLILAAYLIGLICQSGRGFSRILLASAVGTAALYAVGLFYFAAIYAFYLHRAFTLSALFSAVILPCLPGDAVKILLAALLAGRIGKAVRL